MIRAIIQRECRRTRLLEEAGATPPDTANPVGKFVTNRTVWLLWAQYFCMSMAGFYITWLPTYLKERGLRWIRTLSLLATGVLESHFLPETTQKIVVAALAGIRFVLRGLEFDLCGTLSAPARPDFGQHGDHARTMAFIRLSGAAAMLLSVQIKDPLLAMISMGLASFANDLAMPGAWGACMDVGGKYAGSLSGSMNMMGNLAGFIAPNAIPFILAHTTNNWVITFWISAIIYFLGGLCWLFIDPVTPLEPDGEVKAGEKQRS